MSDDKMRAEFEAWAMDNGYSLRPLKGVPGEYWSERTRFALQCFQAAYQAGRKEEREAIFIEWENGELLAEEVERLRAELDAAKAASVVPVKWKSVERFFKPFLSDADLGNKWGIEFWFDTKEQREQFHKWLKKRSEG